MTATNGGSDRWPPYSGDAKPVPHANGDSDPAVSRGQAAHSGHGGHRLMMLACCIPMIVIAVLLVTSGAAGSGALLWALGCVAMMAVMMTAMPGGHSHK